MRLKHALLATAIWTAVALGISVLLVWYVIAHPIPGASTDKRASLLGQGAGTVMVLGYAAIWLPFAYRIGKQRRALQEVKNTKTKKKLIRK
jgi:type II secretory pathway component PulM